MLRRFFASFVLSRCLLLFPGISPRVEDLIGKMVLLKPPCDQTGLFLYAQMPLLPKKDGENDLYRAFIVRSVAPRIVNFLLIRAIFLQKYSFLKARWVLFAHR